MRQFSFIKLSGFLLLLMASSFAKADYVCYTRLIPGSGAAGDHGYLAASIYSGAHCTGAYVALQNYCSTNATSAGCSNSTYFRYTEAQLNSFFQQASNAAQAGSRVLRGTTNCNGGATGCGAYLLFYGN